MQWPCTFGWPQYPGPSKPGLRGRKQHQLVAYVQGIRQEFAADATQLSIGMQSAFCSMFFPDFQLAESIHPLQSEPGLRILRYVELRIVQGLSFRKSYYNAKETNIFVLQKI